MLDQKLIHAFLNQPGTVILPIIMIGWVLSAWGISRTNKSLLAYMGKGLSDAKNGLEDLKKSLLFAWPIYWLMLFFALIHRDLAWSACLAMLPTLIVLPPTLAALKSGKFHFSVSIVSSSFLLLALLALCGSGIGLDREFSRLGGHFILTVFLLYLWWLWPSGPTQSELPLQPKSKIGKKQFIFPLSLYHLGALILLLAALMLNARYQFHPGLTLGLMIALAWTPSLTKILLSSDPQAGNLIPAIPLAIIFFVGPLVLIFGPADFPITLWQMEICTSLLLTLLWMGLTLINQPLVKRETLLLLTLYLVYLTLRILRLFS
jgi:hypothetical protein